MRDIKIKEMPAMDSNPFCFDNDDGRKPLYVIVEKGSSWSVMAPVFLEKDGKYSIVIKKEFDSAFPQIISKTLSISKLNKNKAVQKYLGLTKDWA